MHADQLRKVLLVRAIEDQDAGAVSPDWLTEARSHAGDPTADAVGWISRRAEFLLDRLGSQYQGLAAVSRFPAPLFVAGMVIAYGLGVATNMLGSTGRISVLLNPAMIFIAWSLVAYLFLALGPVLARWFRVRRSQIRQNVRKWQRGSHQWPTPSTADLPGGLLVGWILIPALNRLRTTVRRWMSDHREAASAPKRYAKITKQLLSQWQQCTYALTFCAAKRFVHAFAVCFALGAISGMYLRGLVLEYNVFWSSTFIRDSALPTMVLRTIFAPVRLVLRNDFPATGQIQEIMTDAGALAAPWIHGYAILAVIVVLVPRAALFTWNAVRAKMFTRSIPFDVSEPYWQSLLRDPEATEASGVTARVLGRLALRSSALDVLVGLQASLIEADLEQTPTRPSLIRRMRGVTQGPLDQKKEWYAKWREQIRVCGPDGSTSSLRYGVDSSEFRDAVEILSRPSNRLQANLILLESAVFVRYVAYKPLDLVKATRHSPSFESAVVHRHLATASADLVGESRRAEELGKALEAALKAQTGYWMKVGGLAAIGVTVGVLSGGLAAPAAGALLGEAMGLSGAAAISAGLASLGGGSIAAGGFGVAGGTAAVVAGGGSVLGVGLGAGATQTLNLKPERILLDCAKIEVLLRNIVRGALQDDELYEEIETSLECAVQELRAKARLLRRLDKKSDELGNIEKAVRLLETVLRRNKI